MVSEAATLGLRPFITLQLRDLDHFICDLSTAIQEAAAERDTADEYEIRIVSAFRGRILEHGLISMLVPHHDINVVAACATPDELVTAVIDHVPHLVIIGSRWMEHWPEAQQQLVSMGIDLPHVAVVSAGPPNDSADTGIENDFIYIDDTSLASVVDIIRQIRRAARETGTASHSSLSLAKAPRLCHDDIDQKILALLVTGASNRMIADEVFLSIQTVKNRLSRMMKTAGTTNRTELALRLHAA